MSLAEIKTAIEQLSFEERAQLAAWMHGSPRRVRPVADWNDDEWDPPSVRAGLAVTLRRGRRADEARHCER
jgi:hypothetical protein